MKRITALTIALVLILFLAGCGSSEPDPNCGLYQSTYATMQGISIAVDKVIPGGFSVELKDGGKAVLTSDGKDYNIKWERDGEDLKLIASDITLEGTVSEGVMMIRDYSGSGLDIYLECAELLPKQ